MMSQGHNIFQMKHKSQEVEDMYYSPPHSPINSTQQKLMKHFSSSLDNRVSYVISKEIDKLKAPISQYIMDIYHQSSAKSWSQFVNNSSMNNLSEYNHNTFTILQNFQTQFTKHIYASLSQYLLSTNRYLYKGCAIHLLQHISVIHNYLSLFDIPAHSCMQIDLRSIHHLIHSTTVSNNNGDAGLQWDADDDDELDESIAYDKPSNVRTDINPIPCTNKMKLFDMNDLDINHILRQCITPFDENICKYKRYELLLNGKEIKLFEAKVNNNIPDIECIQNAPLCLIYNSISSTQQIMDKLCDKNTSLVNVSFQKYNDKIVIYIYVVDNNGKLFGSKISKDDLLTKIPLLFEDTTIYKLNNVQFKCDETYRKYYLSLLKYTNKNIHEEKESLSISYSLDPVLLSDLKRIINYLNTNKDETKHINIETIKICFYENNINYNYFRTHKKKK
eukprot:401490_1